MPRSQATTVANQIHRVRRCAFANPTIRSIMRTKSRNICSLSQEDLHFLSSLPSWPSSACRNALLSHGPRQSILLTPVRILSFPHTIPMPNIFCYAIWSSGIHPYCQSNQRTPESHSPSHSEPEQHLSNQHVQDLQADEYDDQQKRDRREIWLCRNTAHSCTEDGIDVG